MKKFFTVLRSELKTQLTLGKVIGIGLMIFLPILEALLVGNVDRKVPKMAQLFLSEAKQHEMLLDLTWMQIGRVIAEAALYSLIIRIWAVMKDKSTLDKNRVTFLLFSKNKILTAKIIADTILFLLSFITTIALGVLIVKYKNGGVFTTDFIPDICVYTITVIALYIAVVIGVRFITAFMKNKIHYGLSITTWLILTIGSYIIVSSVFGIKRAEVWTYPAAHIHAFIYLPFINIISIPMVLYGAVPYWATIPLIIQCIIVIALFWHRLSKSQKEYLCT